MKLIMTKGLPASGKTTWAKEEVLKSNGRTKRVNKDELRAMIDASQWSKKNETYIVSVRDRIVELYLSHGFSVIVDDTNLSTKHEANLQHMADELGAEFEVKSFLDVSLATCIARNAKRENPVPENAIKSMFNTFLKKKGHVAQYQKPPYKEGFPYCIIVDIDGTLAHIDDRSPYDYTKVHTDIVDENVRDVVWRYAGRNIMEEIPDTYIIIVSGRDDTCKPETEAWLKANQIPYDEIFMRDSTLEDEKGNKIDDRIIKRDIYKEWIEPRYNVRFVLDDRDRVVKMWREEGLKVLQVAEGDF